jgi:hypothetical protein
VSVRLLGIIMVGLSTTPEEASGDVYSSIRGASIRMQTVAVGLLIIA